MIFVFLVPRYSYLVPAFIGKALSWPTACFHRRSGFSREHYSLLTIHCSLLITIQSSGLIRVCK